MTHQEPAPIAIIGMACRYPGGANSPEELWNVVAEGRSAWSEVPADRFNGKAFYHPDPDAPGAINQKGGNFIDQDIAAFDPGFFSMSALEAESLDPQQRVFLETSWEAVENAGVTMSQFRGSDTGVFVAMFGHDYEQITQKDPLAFTKFHNTGMARPLLANRVSYTFDLQGPSVVLDTACSGSLVAVNSACQSLKLGETSMALAGGVGLIFSPDQMALMSLTGLFNSEGRSYTFDARGNGYGRGEGVGVVALKRLEDAMRDGDEIRAVIRNSGVNSDGRTNGITLPNQQAQERLARGIFRGLPFTPADVQYAEAHGTGTKAGDAVEMQGIRNVFTEGRDSSKPLLVGTSKPNIGHSEAASGTAGLIKTVMAMEKGLVPPNILLETYKPGLDFDQWNMKVCRSLTEWPSTTSTRKAIVNSFGFGGTNAMCVLESSKPVPTTNGVNGHTNGVAINGTNGHIHVNGNGSNPDAIAKPPNRLFTISARSELSLTHAVDDIKTYVQRNDNVDLDDLSYTLTSRRSHFQWRAGVVASDAESLVSALEAKTLAKIRAPRQVTNAFVFTGQGAQWATMGLQLLSTKNEFSRSISESDQLLRDLGAEWSLVEELSKDGDSSRLNDSRFGQPASTAVQLALVDLLKSWNVLPAAVIGHSSGEIAAAYAAGALSHSAAIKASYHRSFLAELSRQRTEGPGAMMAVGLGQDEVQKYIKKLATSGVEVACINSPSSTTVSGDSKAVADLKKALDADGVFARQLKVDTAYHSNHMRIVSGDYLASLEGLEPSTLQSGVRFFSTVTGKEKSDGFGSSYWVENLVSPVRFSGALQLLSQEMGQGSLNLIEIGPHKALGGPVRQTLANVQQESLSYNYIPTLVRGEDSHQSLMATGSDIFKSGAEFDVNGVATLGLSKVSPKLLKDLPPYHWDHSTTYWVESRLSKEHRHRRHPHHDLLGSRIVTSPDSQPSWRTIMTLDTLPWLRDHVVDNFMVFPGAGYMTMAIQAMRQLDQDHRPNQVAKGYRLKNVAFKKTLTLSRDGPGVETIITFHQSDMDDSSEFTIFSLSEQGKWQEHCNGKISTTWEEKLDEDEKPSEAELGEQSKIDQLEHARQICSRAIDQETLYSEMAAIGNQYGPSFAISKGAKMADFLSLNEIVVPDIAAIMPSQFMQPHVIHPTTLDAIIQTCLPLFQQHSPVRGSVMPLFIGEVFVSVDITNRPGQELSVVCNLSDTLNYSTNFGTSVFHTDANGDTRCVLTMDNGEIRVIGESQALSQKSEEDNIFKMKWGLEVSTITAEHLESVVIPLQSDEVGMKQTEKVDATFLACARYTEWAVKEVRERNLPVKQDHRVNFWKWLANFVDSERGKDLISRSPKTKEELEELTSRLGVEGESIARIGPQLVAIITGETDPLELFLKDELLFRVYHADEGARPNRYLADYSKLLTFQRPGMRILEIGAGTGGTTFQLLQACSPNGEEFCSEYMYTDISSGFFEAVRTTKLKDWAHLLTFQTLDLEKDPADQGFLEHSYDFVIAANVVHATRSLAKSLSTIRRLLKPGGMLGLVELTRTTPHINMTFGSIEGWWAGVDEGRTESPLQSAEQWNEHLLKASFSGVDMAAYDLPEPQRHCAFLLSTALEAPTTTSNGVHPHKVQLLNGIPEGRLGHTLPENMSKILTEKGFDTVVGEWDDTKVDKTCSYVIFDSVDHLLLRHASPDQFKRITSLLSEDTKVYWITFADGDGGIVPDNALTAGLSRAARNENSGLSCFTVDVQDSAEKYGARVSSALARFISTTETRMSRKQPVEFELMYRNGKMHIQRFVADDKLQRALSSSKTGEHETEDALILQKERSLKLHVEKPGLLSSLVFVDDELGELGADEVEIEAHAWGVNFNHVLVALGQMKANQTMVGEFAGVIVRVGSHFTSQYKVGDRVAAMMGTPYASRARTSGYTIHKIPDTMSFSEAASIPLAFGTAYYGLIDCANLEKGQTVLIHAASGGVGQAAIKIAQQIGATIFATVGSASKRQLLVENYGIPESQIFSSRSSDFAAGVKRLTNGVGVDVVLNSLSGSLLQASWECIAPIGAFVEIGKMDIYRRGQLNMEPFSRNVRFASVDLIVLSQHRPKLAQNLLERIFDELNAGRLSPVPLTTMPIGDVEKAFRLMQGGKHTGKIVLEADENSVVNARVPQLHLKNDATYVIVGGLGGLGKILCRRLQNLGARHIALFTRKHLANDVEVGIEKDLTEVSEASVKIVTCDVTNSEAVLKAAADLKAMMPPVKGILHGGMVLSDRTVSQITQEDFEIALQPKYHGTINLYNAFPSEDLDFFIMLSSVAAVIGTIGQSNYAAGGTYQDMFTHSRVAAGQNNFVTLDFPLIRNTYGVTAEHVKTLDRQGCQLLPIESALPVIDYAMSGRAFKEGNHQIAFGLNPRSFIEQSKQGGRVPPLLSSITAQGQNQAKRAEDDTKHPAEDLIAQAPTVDDSEQLILVALREKISSLTALDSQELDLDIPVANMGLDSLVATELKNWITNTLRAPVQTSDIMDSPSLRSLASLVTQSSGLVKGKEEKQTSADEEQQPNGDTHAEAELPKYPLQPLDTVMEVFLDSAAHLGNEEELKKARDTIANFTKEGGIGRRLQERLEKISNEGDIDGVIDMYVKNKWLRGREWRPRLRNFFATFPPSDPAQVKPQTEQASILALAAYDYKLSLDAGTVPQDYSHEQPLSMDTVYWLFNSNRTPVVDCDRAERWADNEYIVVMRRGHGYKVSLREAKGEKISHVKLQAIFDAILRQAPAEVNWAGVFSTANRDEWARTREELMTYSQANHDFLSTVEKSLFLVCFEDATPTNGKDRAACFLLDDNSNRWLDKTVSFVVCANGVSSMFCEHTMVDGTTFDGLIRTIKTASIQHNALNRQRIPVLETDVEGAFTYLPFVIPTAMDHRVVQLRADHLASQDGYELCNYTLNYGASYLRSHKLPPKSVVQLIIQMAVRRYFGYNPKGAVDVISQRPFRGGRTDMIYIQTPPVSDFCAVAEDPKVKMGDRRKLFLEAVKSHARLVTLSTRGRGFRWHFMALKEMLEPGEEVPDLYEDTIYKRTGERPVCTSFTEFGLPEMGRCQPTRADVWVGVQVYEESVRFTVINGERRSDEFAEYLKETAVVMKGIVEANV